MRFLLFAALLTGCVSAPKYEAAVIGHNMFRQVILAADETFAPVYKAAGEETLAANPNDDDAYRKAMAPYEAFAAALVAARDAERIAYHALEQCSDTPDHCDLSRVAFACGRDALGQLSKAGGQIAGTAVIFAAAYVAQVKLDELAEGAECVGAKP